MYSLSSWTSWEDCRARGAQRGDQKQGPTEEVSPHRFPLLKLCTFLGSQVIGGRIPPRPGCWRRGLEGTCPPGAEEKSPISPSAGLSRAEPPEWLSELRWLGLSSVGRQQELVRSMRSGAVPVMLFSLSPEMSTASAQQVLNTQTMMNEGMNEQMNG